MTNKVILIAEEEFDDIFEENIHDIDADFINTLCWVSMQDGKVDLVQAIVQATLARQKWKDTYFKLRYSFWVNLFVKLGLINV